MAEYAIDIAEIPALAELVHRATSGEDVIVTVDGEPVARIAAIDRSSDASLMAEDSLRNWLRPEEDEAWEHLQR
jgi:prevent-host-death family protein